MPANIVRRLQSDAGVTATVVSASALAPRPGYELAKRVFDIAFALTALIVTAPLVLVAVVAIKLDSPGPAFFRQERMGRGGRPFMLLKLRGMYVDAAERHPELYAHDAAGPADGEPFYFHRAGDPRITRVGRVTRMFSIDELPNFWNVLVGDMSVVGPRPEIPALAHLYGDVLGYLLAVRPGVTSPSKACGRDRLSFAENLASDLDYIGRRSFRVDLATIGRTVVGVVCARGVRR